MKRLILITFYTILGLIFTKSITYFDKLGVVKHKTILSDNTNNNGIIGGAPRSKVG